MSKMISGLVFVYVIMTILASALHGGGGINTTYVYGADADPKSSTKIYGYSVDGFLSTDYIIIDGEKIYYNGVDKSQNYFSNCAFTKIHKAGAKVYSQQSSLLNNALGFNVGAITSTVGFFSVVTIPVKFFTTTLPNLFVGNLMTTAEGEMAIFGYIWLAFTIGAVVSIGIAMLWVASGIVKGG